jgi:5'-deoxynucleotidase YfbR-like HD superfamily hydrolase
MIHMTGPALRDAHFSGGEPMLHATPFKLTANGQRVNLLDPRADVFQIESQAHSLAQINRFTGHAARPYSVAEHSLLVVDILERELRAPPIVRFAGLHHDGHESITGDVTSPDKLALGLPWERYEAGWARACHAAWGIAEIYEEAKALIKRADLIALATERRDLMPAHPDQWPALAGVQPVIWVHLNSRARAKRGWDYWRDLYSDQHRSLLRQIR